MIAFKIISLALFGAALQEICHWYVLRKKLDFKSYRKTLRSITYWIITLLMIVCSGFGTYLLFEGAENLKSFHYVVVGAAFPALFSKIVRAVIDDKHSLGDSDESADFATIFSNYFV